jgi:regulator of protease activity HflC (stomatin/prohibitin superfamily)
MFRESATLIVWFIPVLLLVLLVLPQAIRILREYERGVIFRLGKLLGAKGSGLIFLIPIVDRMVKMDLRVVTIHVAPLNLPLAPGRLETNRRNPAMKSPCSR